MGIDNNGKVIVGLEIGEVDLLVLGDMNQTYEDSQSFLDEWNSKQKEKHRRLHMQEDNGYSTDKRYICFVVADSGSYGMKEVPNLCELISESVSLFKETFNKTPKIFVMNYQW